MNSVNDQMQSLEWYERIFGRPPDSTPTQTATALHLPKQQTARARDAGASRSDTSMSSQDQLECRRGFLDGGTQFIALHFLHCRDYFLKHRA